VPQADQRQGHYGWPGHPGQAPSSGQGNAAARAPQSNAIKVAGVIGLVVVAMFVGGYVIRGIFGATKLDVHEAQTGVQQILTDETTGYGMKNVKGVRCNDGQNPTVKKGDTFTCEVKIDDIKRQVTVTFHDGKGAYEVGKPK
jgi:hypothetical protein